MPISRYIWKFVRESMKLVAAKSRTAARKIGFIWVTPAGELSVMFGKFGRLVQALEMVCHNVPRSLDHFLAHGRDYHAQKMTGC